ncbi:MAG: hypothetical protein ACM3MK_10100 [Chitinophagales bacterium]
MAAYLLLIVMAVVLLFTAIYSIVSRERFNKEFGQELRTLLDEAVIIRKDLDAVIENAVMVSDSMIEKLDQRMEKLQELTSDQGWENIKIGKGYQKEGLRTKKKTLNLEELRRAHPYIIIPRLYNEGWQVSEIAEVLDRSQNEVRLILDIETRRRVGG